MTTGGVFTLITNVGIQDKMLVATDMLDKRLNIIKQNRRSDHNILNKLPTLVDIEKTHILYINAHFKPFVAMGYEYNKVGPSSGTTSLGSDIAFSIPQFGDFFHDMVVHCKLDAFTVSQTVSDENASSPTGKWCQFPGERLLQKVRFEVNKNLLDEYTSDIYNFHREFCVPPNKKTGWYRCVGQELPEIGYINKPTGSQVNIPESYRFSIDTYSGHQTPKTTPGSLEVFVPLLFWFNKDPKLSIPSIAIPHGQRFIILSLASQAQLASIDARGNVNGATMGDISINTIELYINNIFMNPEIHDIFIERVGFTMIRVHKYQVYSAIKTEDNVLLQGLKWPIEYMFLGIRRTSYATDNDKWHLFNKVTNNTRSLHAIYSYATDNSTLLSTSIDTLTTTMQEMSVSVDSHLRTVSTLSLNSNGISLYSDFPSTFYNTYTPYHYGGSNINTPEDVGAMFIPFNLYPGAYQPSGYLNVSRSREFYVKYLSASEGSIPTYLISNSNPGTLIIAASAINFLIIKNGSAVLNYST